MEFFQEGLEEHGIVVGGVTETIRGNGNGIFWREAVEWAIWPG